MYHGEYPIKITTAMKDTMEADEWTPELRVCRHSLDTLPSDTRLHLLLVGLLGVQVQVNAPVHHRGCPHRTLQAIWSDTAGNMRGTLCDAL